MQVIDDDKTDQLHREMNAEITEGNEAQNIRFQSIHGDRIKESRLANLGDDSKIDYSNEKYHVPLMDRVDVSREDARQGIRIASNLKVGLQITSLPKRLQ